MTAKKTIPAEAVGGKSTLKPVALAKRFERRGTVYLPGRPLRVSAALYAEMKKAGVLADGHPA